MSDDRAVVNDQTTSGDRLVCGRLIGQPWAERALERGCYRWALDGADLAAAGAVAELRHWLVRHLARAASGSTTERSTLVWTETPMGQAVLSEQLAGIGFFTVGASLRLRVDAVHATEPVARDEREPLKLQLADFDTLIDLADRARQWHGQLATAWRDPILGEAAGQRYRAAELAERWRMGMRLYACQRCDGAPPLGMVGIGADAAGRALVECFAVAGADGKKAGGRLERMLSAVLHRCFAQGRSIVEAIVSADDLLSISRLLASGFSLDSAMLRWHGHFGAEGVTFPS